MGLFESLKALLSSGTSDEAYYALVVDELQSGQLRKGLWAKAMTESGFEENLAKAMYVRLRVQHLKRAAPNIFEVMRELQDLIADSSRAKNEVSAAEVAVATWKDRADAGRLQLHRIRVSLEEAERRLPRVRRLRILTMATASAVIIGAIYSGVSQEPQVAPLIASGIAGSLLGTMIGWGGEAVRDGRWQVRQEIAQLRREELSLASEQAALGMELHNAYARLVSCRTAAEMAASKVAAREARVVELLE